jgi:hypothetical protein
VFISVYWQHVVSRKHVFLWVTAFQNGLGGLTDESQTGKPRTSALDINVCCVEGLIYENRCENVMSHPSQQVCMELFMAPFITGMCLDIGTKSS